MPRIGPTWEPATKGWLAGPQLQSRWPHFAFHFDSRDAVQAMHDQLKADGVAVGGVHDHRDGTASFYLRDPEGNWLEMLYEPPAGFPATRGDGDPSRNTGSIGGAAWRASGWLCWQLSWSQPLPALTTGTNAGGGPTPASGNR